MESDENSRKKALQVKLARAFPDASLRQAATAVLERYGTEKYESETDRVRLAVLKLSGDRPDLKDLSRLVQSAKEDYRDIIAWAEYPRQIKHGSVKDSEERRRLAEADRDEYQTWLRN